MASPLPLIALTVALVAAAAPAAQADLVLGPGQERVLQRALEAGAPLAEGWSVVSARVEARRVVILLRSAESDARFVATLSGAEPPGGLSTRQGWLVADARVPPTVRSALKARLDAGERQLVWNAPRRAGVRARPPPSIDAEAARAAQQALQTRLDRRYGRTTSDPAGSVHPTGAPISRGLVAGEALPADVVETAEAHPDEPRLLSLMARRARLSGEREAAARLVAAALSLPVPDAMALEEARALGWDVADALPGALPAPSREPAAPTWPWWFAAVCLALGALFAAWRTGDRGPPLALLFAAVAAFVAVPEATPQAMPQLPGAMVHPLAGGPCEALPTRVDPTGGLAVHVRCEQDWIRLTVHRSRAHSEAAATTTRHDVGIRAKAPPSPRVRDSVTLLAQAVAVAEAAGFEAPAAARKHRTTEGWPAWAGADDATRAQLRLGAFVVLAALLLALGLLVTRWPTRSTDSPVNRWVIAAFAVCGLTHALAPSAMIMVFGGYDLTSHLVEGRIPRYGVGSVWLYGLPMWLVGHDHAWIQLLNRILGFVACLAAWDLGRDVWREDGPRGRAAAIVCAWLLALLPVVWRAHSSESILVAPALLLLLGLRHWRERPGSAAVLLAAVALCRPEMALVAALVPAWSWASTRAWPSGAGSLAIWGVAGVAVWAATGVATTLNDASALPGMDSPVMGIRSAVEGIGILSNPDMTPLGAWLFLVAGIAWTPRPRAGWATLAVSLVWLSVTGVDLVAVSVPRLHTPILLWLLPYIARGAALLFSWAWARGAGLRAVCGVAAAAVVVSGGWTGYQLFRPTNEDAEEALWRQAVAALPDDPPGCLVTLGYSDPPSAGKSPRFTPGYLLAEGWELFDLSQLEQAHQRCGPRTWVLQGVRCYVDLRQEPPRPAPPAGARVEACVAAESGAAWIPELELTVPNRGDLAFPMYPDGGELELGLYRLDGP